MAIAQTAAISRTSLGGRLRALRVARRWTQAEVATRVGISQPHLSQVESGASSLTAEQFLVVLRLFNVDAAHFDPTARSNPAAAVQNVLVRLGASDLQERDDVTPSRRLGDVTEAVQETLVTGSPRLLTALAPVLVKHADSVTLRRLRVRLTEAGLDRRFAWVVDNVVAALQAEIPTAHPATRARGYRRAELILQTYLDAVAPPVLDGLTEFDIFDSEIRSKQSRDKVAATRSAISQKWGIVSSLGPADFAHTLRSSGGGDRTVLSRPR